jgi:prepilin-type N-terminal cleavage/methylation domain-containing protein
MRLRFSGGFSLVEVMVSLTIFSVVMGGIFVGISGFEKTMKYETAMENVQGSATFLLDRLGRDIRESSYAYVFAGDWYALRDATGVDIEVARNYLSSSPLFGGATLNPGISDEGWAQCPNAVCGWSSRPGGAGVDPIVPNAFLAQPVRNNRVVDAPTFPPTDFQYSTVDARGRLFGHLSPGDRCPECGAILDSQAFFSGILMFSPRREDGSFSYTANGDEARWESMIFYCPFRRAQGGCEMRRYVFYASSINPAAGLADLLDFDGNGLIESPPMTDTSGDFVMDADGEFFGLVPSGGSNNLVYARWDGTGPRSFNIDIDRLTGVAKVTVGGGPYSGNQVIPLMMSQHAFGLSDFEASSFLNNPAWEAGGVTVNPTGVWELGGIRITLQIDRSRNPIADQMETVQTTMFRPRN